MFSRNEIFGRLGGVPRPRKDSPNRPSLGLNPMLFQNNRWIGEISIGNNATSY